MHQISNWCDPRADEAADSRVMEQRHAITSSKRNDIQRGECRICNQGIDSPKLKAQTQVIIFGSKSYLNRVDLRVLEEIMEPIKNNIL